MIFIVVFVSTQFHTNNFQQLPTISNKKFTKKKEKWKMSHNPESWQIDKCDGAKISAEFY